MESQCRHIRIADAFESLKDRLKTVGFHNIEIEDDDPEFKNFFVLSDQLFEDSFFCLEFVLFELRWKNGSGGGIEFHAFFYTRKGRKIQRSLSRNGFERLRTFLDEQLFLPSGLKALEYDPIQPSNRKYKLPAGWASYFPDNVLGVKIHLGGWLCKGDQIN